MTRLARKVRFQMFQRLAGVFVGVAMGIMLSGLVYLLFIQTDRLQPIPELRDDVIAELDAVNQSIQPTGELSGYRWPELSYTNTYRFYLAGGTLGPTGLSDFTGRIVAFNPGIPATGWEDRPGKGADMSLYFEAGKLYCVDAHHQNQRYMIESGKLRQIVEFNWTIRGSDNGWNTPPGDRGEHPIRFYRFSAQGEPTHYGRINQDVLSNPAWDAGSQLWNHPYRNDVFIHDGVEVAGVWTGPDGQLQILQYQHAEGKTTIVFGPNGRIVSQSDRPQP